MQSEQTLRFGGISRLYGEQALACLRQAHVGVIGLGGVGSWAVEALARTGIGNLTLVDMDEICVSNVNRQLHALEGAIGRSKAEVLAERVRAINPSCRTRAINRFFRQESAEAILAAGYDCVIDAIDSVREKCLLIAACREHHIPLIVTGGAGGRRDPGRIEVADLARAHGDRLLRKVRGELRRTYGFPRSGRRFGIECVFSGEQPSWP
ncbi:MAG: tRNA threonylcarbamoyladenosine dehydratase, partial [Gammaproteobacteria bacterium]